MNLKRGQEVKNIRSVTGEKILTARVYNVLENTTVLSVGTEEIDRVLVKNEELRAKGYYVPKFKKVPFTRQA